jgi:hypothetical protein
VKISIKIGVTGFPGDPTLIFHGSPHYMANIKAKQASAGFDLNN